MVIEIASFELNEWIEKEDFLENHSATHHNWVVKQNWFLRRETYCDSSWLWKDVVLWENIESAQAAAKVIGSEPGNLPWLQMINGKTVEMYHWNKEF